MQKQISLVLCSLESIVTDNGDVLFRSRDKRDNREGNDPRPRKAAANFKQQKQKAKAKSREG